MLQEYQYSNLIINQLLNLYSISMAQKKKPSKLEEDQLTIKIPNLFKKRCEMNGLGICKPIKEKLEQVVEEGKLETLQLWEDIGPIHFRSLMDCLSDLSYPHLKKLRLWKVDLQDEGLRSICNYIDKASSIEYLDLMDNHITFLGCQFLGKSLATSRNNIIKLRLDNNPIGNEGLAQLSVGLRQNSKIEKISLNFCGIDQHGVKYIQEMLANIECRLRTLKMMGNALKNEGVFEILRAVNNCGDQLQKLNLGDTQLNILNYKEDMGDSIEEKIERELLSILKNNSCIAKYNFRNNWIPDSIAKKMLLEAKDNKIIFLLELPDCISHPLKELHAEIMKKRKLKKKKAKGKGSKGKSSKANEKVKAK